MPEYLAPGVYIEETSFGRRSIGSVDAATAAFVGPTRSGPAGATPAALTSVLDFEAVYGSVGDLARGRRRPVLNYLAHAVRHFFANGGRKLYVARVLEPAAGRSPAAAIARAYAAALDQLADLDDVSIVAAPGYSALAGAEPAAVQEAMLAHVNRPGSFRMAVLDAAPAQSVADVLAAVACVDSMHAALYYPWVIVPNPLAAEPGAAAEIALPPSGFVCGVYARVAFERGVAKAPANEPVAGALRLERDLTQAEQDLLNPRGVNCLRTFPGRGIVVWGARTTSTDPEWKYVNVRRLLDYLEHSIERGTQWTVFEPNGEALWLRVRSQVSDFLVEQWRAGLLQGAKATDAFFVRCDRTTMTQTDLDEGRLVCLVGVAAVRPAEFVIFRFGQKTAGNG